MRVLVVGPQNKGPQWQDFPHRTHADVEFSTSIGVGSLADHKDKKVIVNPNAMILMEFTN